MTPLAFTWDEWQAVLDFAAKSAAVAGLHPGTTRTRRAVADLAGMLAGTGIRVGEAIALRWEHIDLTTGTTAVPGTKSRAARRTITLPAWLLEAMLKRAGLTGSKGYVSSSPRLAGPESMWDTANCSRALTAMLVEAGYPWGPSHTFRKTVASILSESGKPLQRIADRLGHADPSMTASVYLGRSWSGDKADLAEVL